MHFTKKALSISDQIKQLEERGLLFEGKYKDKAAHYLSNISYYRLSAYWFTLLEDPASAHKFKKGSTFRTAIETYVFDRKLRILIFDEIERVEIALRTQIIYQFAHAYGNNWYEDASLFKDSQYYKKFNSILTKSMDDTNEIFIKHYRDKYKTPLNPPCWMALELLSLGQLSMMFKNIKDCPAKKEVASHFGLHETILESWLESVSIIRNTCAHHSRLWNRKIPKTPKIPKKTKEKWISILPNNDKRTRIYLILACISYLLRRIVPDTQFSERLHDLLDEFSEIPKDYMGFPNNWEKDTFWIIS